MKVEIPFKERFRKPMLDGTKTMTSRTKRYGNVGDTFTAFGAIFKITDVYKMRLSFIIYDHYKEEGFDSIKEAMEVWKQIHPIKGYVPDWLLWVHVFKSEADMEVAPFAFTARRGSATVSKQARPQKKQRGKRLIKVSNI